MRAHPSRNDFEFFDGRIAFQVVASPADERDVPSYIALVRNDTVNARRIVPGLARFIPEVQCLAAARAGRRIAEHLGQVGDRQIVRVKGKIAFAYSLQYALSHNPCPHRQRVYLTPLTCQSPLDCTVSLGIIPPTFWNQAGAVGALPIAHVIAPTRATDRLQPARALFVRREVGAGCGENLPTLTALPLSWIAVNGRMTAKESNLRACGIATTALTTMRAVKGQLEREIRGWYTRHVIDLLDRLMTTPRPVSAGAGAFYA